MTRNPNSYPITGHALKHEGAPHDNKGNRLNHRGEPADVSYSIGATGEGRALCECGALSEELPSRNKRAAWHRQHKAEIRSQKGTR